MREFYYLEVNIICIIFLTFINHKTTSKKKSSLTEKIFRNSVFASELLCFSDAVFGIVDGHIFPGCIVLNHLLNMLFFISGTFAAMGWLFFVSTKICKKLTKKFMALNCIPSLLVSLLMITNPLTSLAFTVDENNFYARGPLIFIQWISIIYYLVYATILVLNANKKEYNRIVRATNLSYCYFGIFPIVGFMLQVFVPGMTSTTVGVALGYLFYYIKSLENQISEDVLTGLNNRKQMEKYVSDLVYRDSDSEKFVMMMDLNGFKNINDTFGHTTGDLALQDFADALRLACRKWRGHYMLCRYGGDEFAVVGEHIENSDLQVFADLIRKNVEEISVQKNREYKLSTSIGYVTGLCKKLEDFTHMYKDADALMYEDKMRQKILRTN